MGTRGPKRTPTTTLKLRGSWRAKTRKNEPGYDPGEPECPKFLGEEGKREWIRIMGIIMPTGVMTHADRAALAMYCHAWESFIEVDRLVKNGAKGSQKGMIVVSAKGNLMINPAEHCRANCWQRVLKAASEFGFTPVSRSRIQIDSNNKGKEKEDKERFFAG